MEHEILFRGRRVDNGEWVEGGCLSQWFGSDENMKNCVYDSAVIGVRGERSLQTPPDENGVCLLQMLVYEVDPSTVGQFTGLLDRNGTKIFKGDRVKVFNRSGTEPEFTGVITYGIIPQKCSLQEKHVGFYIDFEDEWWRSDIAYWLQESDRCEIIGTIHDTQPSERCEGGE